MAKRIRKLAKEMGWEVQGVIGVLHALGITRYRSPEDMIPPAIEKKIRRGIREGVKPTFVKMRGVAKSPLEQAASGSASDVMSTLVPGVVREGHKPRQTSPSPRSTPRTPPASAPRSYSPPAAPTTASRPIAETPRSLEIARAALDSDRRRLTSERALLDAERQKLAEKSAKLEARERGIEAEAAALMSLREALEAEQAAVQAERLATASQQEIQATSTAVPLMELLEARGLIGTDEFERAIGALCERRVLRSLLWSLRVEDEPLMKELLDERLLLVEGEPPAVLEGAFAMVSVAPSRADIPRQSELTAQLSKVSELLLLNGLRRVVFVGGKPLWQRLFRDGLDRRIEFRFAPRVRRTAVIAQDDVTRTDAVILCNTAVTEDARRVYDTSRALLIESRGEGLADIFKAIVGNLEA